MKRNKIRYQSADKPRICIVLSGKVLLQYVDDDAIAQAGKGDVMVYPRCDVLHTIAQGDYYSTGFSGYFKVDVHDGKKWCPVLVQDIFTEREHHFSKNECPIDTYELCSEALRALQGKTLLRTYREHYTLDETNIAIAGE